MHRRSLSLSAALVAAVVALGIASPNALAKKQAPKKVARKSPTKTTKKPASKAPAVTLATVGTFSSQSTPSILVDPVRHRLLLMTFEGGADGTSVLLDVDAFDEASHATKRLAQIKGGQAATAYDPTSNHLFVPVQQDTAGVFGHSLSVIDASSGATVASIPNLDVPAVDVAGRVVYASQWQPGGLTAKFVTVDPASNAVTSAGEPPVGFTPFITPTVDQTHHRAYFVCWAN